MKSIKAPLLVASLSLFSSLASACKWDDDSYDNRCPFVPCYDDWQCASGTCMLRDNDLFDTDGKGVCQPPGWLFAIMIIAAVLIVAGFITLCVCCCCCCCRKRRSEQDVHVYNHLIDANGNPYVVETNTNKKNNKKGKKEKQEPQTVSTYYAD